MKILKNILLSIQFHTTLVAYIWDDSGEIKENEKQFTFSLNSISQIFFFFSSSKAISLVLNCIKVQLISSHILDNTRQIGLLKITIIYLLLVFLCS